MRVYNSLFVHIYTITAYERLQVVKKYIGKSIITLTFGTNDDAVYFLQRNNFIVFDDGEPFVIKHIVQGLEKTEITAYGCHALLDQRITGTGATKNVLITKTGSADEVVKHFIDQSKGDLPVTTAAIKTGTSISDQTRLKILGEEVIRILDGAGRGEMFTLDSVAKRIVFDSYAGTDKTRGNAADNPPVVFSVEFGNVRSLSFSEDATGEQSTIYVGGAGEGADREIVIVGGTKTGLDRIERFRDARDVETGDTGKLTERGTQEIIETGFNLSAEAVAQSGLIYGTDYELGDIVTTRIERKDYSTDGDYYNRRKTVIDVEQRITEVCITREYGKEDIDLRFGSEPIQASAGQVNARAIAQLNAVEPKTPITDHGEMGGLADDDHTQYYNATRGDARYWKLGNLEVLIGYTVVTPDAANTNKAVSITFSTEFSGTPRVVCTPNTNAASTVFVGANALSTTGFTLNVQRPNTSAIGIHWIAVWR